MFQLSLCFSATPGAFTAGDNLGGPGHLPSARGGLQFMLIIWLQGIWLPLHGYAYSDTPLWAGIFLLPLTAGFSRLGPGVGGPVRPVRFAGDRHCRDGRVRGRLRRPDAAAGQLPLLGVRVLIAANGIGSGMFASPNSSSIMGSVPARQRGAASGMRSTFQNSGTALSIGMFFSLIVAGLASSLPATLTRRPAAPGRPVRRRSPDGPCRPVSSLFAAVLGGEPGAAPAGRRPMSWSSLFGRESARPHRPGALRRS